MYEGTRTRPVPILSHYANENFFTFRDNPFPAQESVDRPTSARNLPFHPKQ
jgi:hypothetical protein